MLPEDTLNALVIQISEFFKVGILPISQLRKWKFSKLLRFHDYFHCTHYLLGQV